MNSDEITKLPLDSEEARHCTDPFSKSEVTACTDLETLPYDILSGQSFERLIFELLIAQGYIPHYFGRSGQEQPEIDIVASREVIIQKSTTSFSPNNRQVKIHTNNNGKTDGVSARLPKVTQTAVFSCKNLKEEISFYKLKERLTEFERKWLKIYNLPKPDLFFICWPQSLRDQKIKTKWSAEKVDFQKRTKGIKADIWGLEYINSLLKKRPDIVADLFSDKHAKFFCDIDHNQKWNQDLFVPVKEDDQRFKNFYECHKNGKLYIDEDYEQSITEALNKSSVIQICGLPGTGKTFTALSVAEKFRVMDIPCCTYSLDVSHPDFNAKDLKDGIRLRQSRTTLFLLENTHLKPEVIEYALRDLDSELKQGKVKIICLARRVPRPDLSRNDDSDYFLELEAEGAVIEFENNDKRLRQIIEFWYPKFKGISKKRLEKLCAVAARDLFLLDKVLSTINSIVEIDTLTLSAIYEPMMRHYFPKKTPDELKNILYLAALGQFDLRPLADVFKLTEKESGLISSLSVKAGNPPRWYFLHSTASELVLHSILSFSYQYDSSKILKFAAEKVIDYFGKLQSEKLEIDFNPSTLETDLLSVVVNRLKLLGVEEERKLKAIIMDSEPAQTLFKKQMGSPDYLGKAARCTFIAHRMGAKSVETFYAKHLLAMVRQILSTDDSKKWVAWFPLFGSSLRTLKSAAPSDYAQLNLEINIRHLLDMLISNGTIPDLLRIVANASSEFDQKLVDLLNKEDVTKLINRTIGKKIKIGTLGLAFRDLQGNEENRASGKVLESKIGPVRFLELIEANGTVSELFDIVKYASPDFAGTLIDALDEARVAKLIQRTIAAKRSIGTLNLALFELRKNEETKTLGEALERKIGPVRFLDLIEANGTIVDLFKLAEKASPKFASQLIDALDELRVAKLIQQTIAAKRSIGTLDFSLFELHKNEETKVLGKALERKIGSLRFLELIEANGTVFELFKIVEHASPEFAGQLIDALDEARVTKLIEKTIDAGRSIGTINLTLRGLRNNPDTASLADDLEQKIGVAGFWTLLLGTGSPGPLVDLKRDIGQDLRQQFIAAAHKLYQQDWARLLRRGDLFQLVELLQECEEIFDEQAGGSRLLGAIDTEVSNLAATSNWYELNTSHKRLAKSLALTARDAVERAMDAWLSQVDIESLSFPSLHESVNGLELLSAKRPESIPLLATRLWKLLPPVTSWQLDPKKDMALPRLLLRIVSQPAFFDADAERVKAELARCLTPQIVAKCRTVDILWTSWAFLAFDANRSNSKTCKWGRGFPASLKTSVIAALEQRAAKTPRLEEHRARFALLGLLSLMDAAPTCQRASGLYSRHPNLRNLIQDQTFVMAFFIAKGIALVEPRQTIFTPYLCRDLLGRASLYPQLDQATEWLRQDILNP